MRAEGCRRRRRPYQAAAAAAAAAATTGPDRTSLAPRSPLTLPPPPAIPLPPRVFTGAEGQGLSLRAPEQLLAADSRVAASVVLRAARPLPLSVLQTEYERSLRRRLSKVGRVPGSASRAAVRPCARRGGGGTGCTAP